MAKKCINTRYGENRSKDNSVSGKNDLYKIFNKLFDKFFSIGTEITSLAELKEIYVPNIKIEAELDQFRNSPENTNSIYIGTSGIGKTTSIYHSFNLDPNEDVAKINYSKKELVFSVRINDLDIDPQNFSSLLLTEQLSAVCAYLFKQFPESGNKLRCNEGRKELFDFINFYVPYVLSNEAQYELVTNSEDMNTEEVIKSLLSFAKINLNYS